MLVGSPLNKVKIAWVTGYTGVRIWTKYPNQQSVSVHLTGGERYYIEALHNQASGSDNLAVGWQLSNGTLERPIQGNRLSPFNATSSAGLAAREIADLENVLNGEKSDLTLYPNPLNGV
jgi:hypothetical protein